MADESNAVDKKRKSKGDKKAKKYFNRYKKGGPKKQRVKL
uniref:Uncharacterized protein n=1 Tax=uncultured Poseidoniia archaeon TaxID=1697135 RepID=A0A1B1TB85_9ARCH|nr:hypothetical protein [uncultured Candidatus Thalassoarchaea sp.]